MKDEKVVAKWYCSPAKHEDGHVHVIVVIHHLVYEPSELTFSIQNHNFDIWCLFFILKSSQVNICPNSTIEPNYGI